MRRITGYFLFPALLAIGFGLPADANAAEPVLLTITAGAFDVGKGGVENPELGFDIRLAPTTLGFLPQRFAIRPTIGATGNGLGSFWTYLGFRFDKKVTQWILTPGFAVSLYEEGEGLNLGGALEFRSSFEAAVLIRGKLRTGVAFYHLSNADIYDSNPGSESLVFTIATPLARR